MLKMYGHQQGSCHLNKESFLKMLYSEIIYLEDLAVLQSDLNQDTELDRHSL